MLWSVKLFSLDLYNIKFVENDVTRGYSRSFDIALAVGVISISNWIGIFFFHLHWHFETISHTGELTSETRETRIVSCFNFLQKTGRVGGRRHTQCPTVSSPRRARSLFHANASSKRYSNDAVAFTLGNLYAFVSAHQRHPTLLPPRSESIRPRIPRYTSKRNRRNCNRCIARWSMSFVVDRDLLLARCSKCPRSCFVPVANRSKRNEIGRDLGFFFRVEVSQRPTDRALPRIVAKIAHNEPVANDEPQLPKTDDCVACRACVLRVHVFAPRASRDNQPSGLRCFGENFRSFLGIFLWNDTYIHTHTHTHTHTHARDDRVFAA